MTPYVLFFDQIDHISLPYVGGKGANLGELTKAGFPVPGGFCVTTYAYREFIAGSPKMDLFFDALKTIDPTDLNLIREWGQQIRTHLQQLEIPSQISNEIIQAWTKQGATHAYAVRSSATAEDLPNASFAGQQDTYLNIKGQDELLEHVRKCWASLFTDRAIAYRAKNAFDHSEVYLSIVVQQMVMPDISGILFTADPVTGNRTIVSIDASFGLGEALVSGLVSADLYQVKQNRIIYKKISQKKTAIYPLSEGGTTTQDLPARQQGQQAMTEQQILDLAALGKQIQQHYGTPQDIEFCMVKDDFFIVQSRPITTLYPLPEIPEHPLRVLLSFGHVQMMPNAIKPLGRSVLRTAFPPQVFVEAGSRIYIDLTDFLLSKLVRIFFPKLLKLVDEAMSRSLDSVVKRPGIFAGNLHSNTPGTARKLAAPILKKAWKVLRTGDPRLAKPRIEALIEEKMQQTRQALSSVQGAERLQVVQRQLDGMIVDILQEIIPYVVPGILANKLLEKMLLRWMGNAAELHTLNKSLPGNVTTEMGLQLGDLADLLRTLPEVEEYLKTADDQTFYTGLAQVAGGITFRHAFEKFIDQYGMRCPGEIDLTNPRWREMPTQLRSAIFSHMQSVKPGEHRQRFAEGKKEADEAILRILSHVKDNPFKLKLTTRLIAVFRYLGGLREHHKYLMSLILDECKKAIMAEVDELVAMGILKNAQDAYFLRLDELIEMRQGECSGNAADLIAKRKEQHQWHQHLKPPRIMTSEGEIIIVPPDRKNIPEGTLIGSPVSAGTAEGIARIILRPENAVLREGEILVSPQTDPGWTPLFQSAKAIVTEVGGLMTHGAVVAREYGIPAVVGVDDATTLINDGDRIRVDGDQGFVEILNLLKKDMQSL
ncbi:phosphoenolpyruvate synthase [Pelosinus propionicus]|uniref:Phosphoenolpyruvate synthase n=1 Tax=Pelosinus propionicus DSM 13327 TaxID=1123291 RepID=A0A1I4Q657_9FIRM|nr:phosphoenolpyruvate synthase [Pelosinus propionicus]SFM35559.1 phosphoenolpyruvate synthase [Pelosinus propionicus DSM 13327]